MAGIPAVLILVVIVAAIMVIIFTKTQKGVPGIKMMLLGINITLLGGIIAVDPNSSLAGFEYLIALGGLIVSISGLGRD